MSTNAETETAHEWRCPSCGAVTRARMADHPAVPPDERRTRVLAQAQRESERRAIGGTPCGLNGQ